MRQLAICCPDCGQPLIEMRFNKHFVTVCDNWKCYLYRQQQGYRVKDTTPHSPKQNNQDHTLRASYGPYLEQRKLNYHQLRAAGIDPITAARSTSNKGTREILNLLRKVSPLRTPLIKNTPEYIPLPLI